MTAAGFDGSAAARTSISSRCATYGNTNCNTNCTVPGDADAARISRIIL
jgi:hypothetical protein